MNTKQQYENLYKILWVICWSVFFFSSCKEIAVSDLNVFIKLSQGLINLYLWLKCVTTVIDE